MQSLSPDASNEDIGSKAYVQSTSGSYTFEIDGYLALPDEVGETLESPEFELCSRLWQLRIFPGGSLQAHKGHISFYLASKSSVVTRASYKLILVNQSDGADEVFQSAGPRKFEAKGVHVDGWGRDKFISQSILKDPQSGYCEKGKVMFKTEIIVYGGLTHSHSPHLSFGRGSKSLKLEIGQLLDDSDTADINIYIYHGQNEAIDDEESKMEPSITCNNSMLTTFSSNMLACKSSISCDSLKAHKTILCARSPVFRAMLVNRESSYSMSECMNSEINIYDVELDAMKEVLRYLYTDSCSDIGLKTNCDKILKAANKYQILGLQVLCEEYICSNLKPHSAAEYLSLADHLMATDLKKLILDYISLNIQSVIASPKYLSLSSELQCEVISLAEKRSKARKCRDSDGWKRAFAGCCIL